MEGRDIRELKDLGKSLVRELTRLADANEAIVKLAGEQQEVMEAPQPGPPFCPHCGQFNPVVRLVGDGSGALGDFVLIAQCDNCKEILFGIPEGWTMLNDKESAREYLDERKGGSEHS